MKDHQMYPYNPESAESYLNEKLKNVPYGWVDNQRAIVLESMEEYADAKSNATRLRYVEQVKQILERANDKGMFYYDQIIKEIEKL